jgi:hypothetical protein
LSLGGAYRKADTYAFNINNAFSSGATTSLHLSSTLSYGSWVAGAEFGEGGTDGFLGAPTIGAHAYLIALAYSVNTNLQLTVGWQKLNYSRNIGLFYNGAPRIAMDAEFLHAVLKI